MWALSWYRQSISQKILTCYFLCISSACQSASQKKLWIIGKLFTLTEFSADTHCPLEVCTRSVTRVDVAGQTQFSANMAYLNSSSHTTWSKWHTHRKRDIDTATRDVWFQVTWFALTCKLDVKLIFRFKNLDVKRAIWSKVFGSPSSEYSLMILEEEEKEEQKHFFNYNAAVDSFVKAIWILWNVKFAWLTHKSDAFCNKTRTSPVHC